MWTRGNRVAGAGVAPLRPGRGATSTPPAGVRQQISRSRVNRRNLPAALAAASRPSACTAGTCRGDKKSPRSPLHRFAYRSSDPPDGNEPNQAYQRPITKRLS